MSVPKCACSPELKFYDIPPFPSCVTCTGMHLTWMHRVSRTCVQVIVPWPSVIVTTCSAITALGGGSNLGCTVMDVACLFHVASVSWMILLSLPSTRRSDMRRIWRCFRSVLMGSWYPKLGLSLFLYVVHTVTCISPNPLIIGRVTTTISFVLFVTYSGYLLAGITSHCLPYHRHEGRVMTSRLRVGGKNWSCLDGFLFQLLRSLHINPVTF